tara:strand:- start:35219 stop:35767 length:549 start_codon:yes stop_codon:yes gene_type:complete
MSQHNHSKRSLSIEVEKLLNEQIVLEGKSSASYLSMASWCETEGYANASNFLYAHSDEERGHMLKIFSYINEAGGHALQPEITNIKHKFSSLREVFEDVLEHEIHVTKSIHEIVDHCLSNKDFSTFSYLQWFVTEQREEESLARRILEIFDIIGEDGVGLWTIDQEIGKISAAQAAAAGAEA